MYRNAGAVPRIETLINGRIMRPRMLGKPATLNAVRGCVEKERF
jgi:hypothetical protein